MVANRRIAVVGPGNLGSALAVALRDVGYEIEIVITRRTTTSLKLARALVREVGAPLLNDLHNSTAKVIWLCVPDSQIARVASQVAKELKSAKGLIVLHSSGALTSDELRDLRRRGAHAASVHPLMTFVAGSRPSLAGVPFAIEGDAAALREARRIIKGLAGNAYSVSKKDKAAYHAWGAFTSPLLTSLLAVSERVAQLAGVDRKSARQRMIPILLQTVANYARLGTAGAFSGPIMRGDTETVRKHLQVLRRTPGARDVYVALARTALQNLPAKNRGTLRKLLSVRGD